MELEAIGRGAEAESLLEELSELVDSLGIGIVGRSCIFVRDPNRRYLTGSGKAAELGLTLPAIRAWYADGLPDAPRRAGRDLCAGCPFAAGVTSAPSPETNAVAATAGSAQSGTDVIAVPNWPTRHTPIDRPKGEHG